MFQEPHTSLVEKGDLIVSGASSRPCCVGTVCSGFSSSISGWRTSEAISHLPLGQSLFIVLPSVPVAKNVPVNGDWSLCTFLITLTKVFRVITFWLINYDITNLF